MGVPHRDSVAVVMRRTLLVMLAVLTPVAGAAGLGLRPVARSLDGALQVVQAPGESRLLVVERGGLVVPIRANGTVGSPWLDIRGRVGTQGMEQGLLGLAFAPDFATSGGFYVDYTDRSGNTRVVGFRTRPGAARVSTRTARLVLHQIQPYVNHNGGGVAFGPDGMLYVALGDGGGTGDPQGNAANTGTLLGKILRIDPSRRSGGRGYAIPDGNPFANAPGARPEIWHLGLRNPWRFSFDRATGDMWIGDVGQNAIEEVDRAPAGKGGLDFGWNRREGTSNFLGGARTTRETDPVAQYAHGANGCSVTGGYVYRGTAVPTLTGRYVFADWCSGRVWAMEAGSSPGPAAEITGHLPHGLKEITSFGEDRAGEIYAVTPSAVYRLTR